LTVKRTKCEAGSTLVEAAIVTVILLAAILCTCAFRYDAALCRRKADKQAVAVRTSLPEFTYYKPCKCVPAPACWLDY